MTIEEIDPSGWRSGPWGAAQGTTHEIRRWPDGSGGYVARVSVADIVAAGPFTALPGYRRWLAVLDDGGGGDGGGGLELTIGARRWRGTVGDAVWFDGGEPVHATITGPSRVWNLIVREHVACSAAWYRDARALALAGGVAIVYAVATSRTRIVTASRPIDLAVEPTPAIVVHLGVGC